jgi:hypothetical protein
MQELDYLFKLCAAAPWGAVRNSKGAAIFDEIFKYFYLNLANFSIKSCSMLFIIKNKPIFYTNSLKLHVVKGFSIHLKNLNILGGAAKNFRSL